MTTKTYQTCTIKFIVFGFWLQISTHPV